MPAYAPAPRCCCGALATVSARATKRVAGAPAPHGDDIAQPPTVICLCDDSVRGYGFQEIGRSVHDGGSASPATFVCLNMRHSTPDVLTNERRT